MQSPTVILRVCPCGLLQPVHLASLFPKYGMTLGDFILPFCLASLASRITPELSEYFRVQTLKYLGIYMWDPLVSYLSCWLWEMAKNPYSPLSALVESPYWGKPNPRPTPRMSKCPPGKKVAGNCQLTWAGSLSSLWNFSSSRPQNFHSPPVFKNTIVCNLWFSPDVATEWLSLSLYIHLT